MISKYDIIRALRKTNENSLYGLNDSESHIINLETGHIVCSVEEFTNDMRKKHHCDFEVIYDEHASLTVIYRCRDCGAVIFGGDDEDRYDTNLECPVCGQYKTHLQYWTKEEIETDIEKQNTIQFYKNVMSEMNAQALRKKKRGLNDWEIWQKSFKTAKGKITFSLECLNLFHSGLKGLRLEVKTFKEEAGWFIRKKEYYIPLSAQAFKMWMYRRKLKKNNLKEEVMA